MRYKEEEDKIPSTWGSNFFFFFFEVKGGKRVRCVQISVIKGTMFALGEFRML